MRSCNARYFGFLLLNKRNGSTNSGRSASREMLNAPYLLTTDFRTLKKSEK